MNYKTCYHRQRKYKRCRRRQNIMTITNTLLIFLAVSMFIGVLVVQAATFNDKSSQQVNEFAEVTVCKMTQASANNHMDEIISMNERIVKSIEDKSTEVKPTPLVIDAPPEVKVKTTEEIVQVVECTIDDLIGEKEFEFEGNTFVGYDMPNVYYPEINYNFEPYMDYRCITNKSSPAYAVSHSENAYTDEYGLRRYITSDDKFKVNGEDDYIIALGTFYKPKGECGSRYLIVTTTGMFTIITGDEKADRDTDEMNMFSLHADGTCGGIVEWIVDTRCLETTMRRAGTITAGPVEALKGEITHIYRIN